MPNDTRAVKIPGPDHPISIEHTEGRVIVKVSGVTIADSTNALTLREAKYPPVFYLPRDDVDMAQLVSSEHATYCPYKGDCSYLSIAVGGERSANAVWTYVAPFESVFQIKGHLAFYPDRVDSIEELATLLRSPRATRSGLHAEDS